MQEFAQEIEEAALIAAKVYMRAHRIPSSDRPDILSDARFGACQAAGRWDSEKSSLKNWAIRRAKGEILDGARRRYRLTQPHQAVGDEVNACRDVSLDEILESGKHSPFLLEDPSDYFQPIQDAIDASKMADSLLAILPDRLLYVVRCVYFENQTLAQIGASLGVTESRACQIHTQALRMMRAHANAA